MYLEKNKLKTASTSIEGTGTDFLPYNIPLLIEKMKKDKAWKDGELTSMVLQKDMDRKIVLAMLPAEAEVVSYQVDESVTFRVLEGKVNLSIGKKSFPLAKGEVFKLNEKIKYLLNTIDETALLMTIDSEK